MTQIARDEWLKALSDAGLPIEDDQQAVTVPEFCAMFGLKRQAAVMRLETLVAAGKATRTHKRQLRSDGNRAVSYVAYRLA